MVVKVYEISASTIRTYVKRAATNEKSNNLSSDMLSLIRYDTNRMVVMILIRITKDERMMYI